MKKTVTEQVGAASNHLGLLPVEASMGDRLVRMGHNVARLALVDRAVIARREQELSGLARQVGSFVVQVGAFDGEYDDPLQRMLASPHVSALLIEPQQAAFERLEARHRGDRSIKCVRSAIAASQGELTLYRAVMENGDRFGVANARTDREKLKKIMRGHPLRVLRGYEIEPEVVPATTLPQLLEDNDIDPSRITVFCSDTEGMDGVVIDQLMNTSADPSYIQYEHLHVPQSTVTDANLRLHQRGYDLEFTYTDVIALRN